MFWSLERERGTNVFVTREGEGLMSTVMDIRTPM